MSWSLIPLSDFVTIQKGKKHETVELPSQSSHRFIQIDDLRNDENIKYTDDSKGVIANVTDVIIAWDGANAGTIGFGKSGFIGSTLAKLSFDTEKVDTEYLGRFLQSKFRELRENCTGATIPHISKRHLVSLKIPLPSLEIQKQIAAVLEKADQLRKDCQQMEQELNSLAQSMFIDMFGSKAPGYSKWPLHHIEELAESKKGSMRTGPFGSDLKHSEFVDEGIAVIGIDNAVKNEFAWGERRFITPEKYEKLKRYRVYPQDLIITIMGTTGRIAVIPNDIPLSISTKHLAVITLDKEKVLPEFLAIAIKTHPDLLHQILDSNKGAIMDGLNLGLIKALSLKLPPLDLQSEYLAVLKVIQEQVFESRSSLKQHNDLFNALMQKAFKGELNL